MVRRVKKELPGRWKVVPSVSRYGISLSGRCPWKLVLAYADLMHFARTSISLLVAAKSSSLFLPAGESATLLGLIYKTEIHEKIKAGRQGDVQYHSSKGKMFYVCALVLVKSYRSSEHLSRSSMHTSQKGHEVVIALCSLLRRSDILEVGAQE